MFIIHTANVIYLISSVFFMCANCFNFDVVNVDVIQQQHDYFGYSVMLQKGSPSVVLVGAPKAKENGIKSGIVFKCIISRKQECYKYNLHIDDPDIIEDGQMLGATMEGSNLFGGSFIACSPRTIRIESTIGQRHYFSNGLCFKIKNSTDITSIPDHLTPLFLPSKQVTKYDGNPQYYYAFGETGTSINYNLENNEFIFGAPGIMTWAGSIVRYHENNFSQPTANYRAKYSTTEWTIPNPTYSSILKRTRGILLGLNYNTTVAIVLACISRYSVTSGRFKSTSKQTWYVAGAPRGEKLNGLVLLFVLEDNSESSLIEQEVLIGKQVGSYFGASVLSSDFSNGIKVADLFIGAPLFSHNWEEGRVYFYKNKGNGTFESPIEIDGSYQSGSRFGTTIADLGDIDRDGYKDVAISAPYENDGVGAVYIYRGGQSFKPKYSQKISPETFKVNFPVRGFGFSISKGVDIDNNLYNDIAIGAYKTKQVFIIKTCPVVQLHTKLYTNVSEIIFNTSSIQIRLCVGFTETTTRVDHIQADLKIDIDDDRAIYNNENLLNTFQLYKNRENCIDIPIKLKSGSTDYIKPLKMNSIYNISSVTQEHISNCLMVNPNDANMKTLTIPFSHGCGSDQICQVDLKVDVSTNKEHIIIGAVDTITLNISLFNKGNEPAYLCYVYLNLPKEVEVEQIHNRCELQNKILKCLIDNRLQSHQHKMFLFDMDIRNININTKTLSFDIEANSTGKETYENDNMVNITIPVDTENSVQVTGKSIPEQLSYVNNDGETFVESLQFIQEYKVINFGPSPLDVKIDFLIPVKIDNLTFVKVYKPEAQIDNELNLQCLYDDTAKFYNEIEIPTTPNYNKLTEDVPESERAVDVNCKRQNVQCAKITCSEGYLHKQSQSAVITFNIEINITLFTTIFKNALLSKDIITFKSYATNFAPKHFTESQVKTIIYGKLAAETIATWIIILAILTGIFFLSNAVLILYKMGFFKRSLREKLLEATEEIDMDPCNQTDNS